MFHGGVREFLVGYRFFVISLPDHRDRLSQEHRGQRFLSFFIVVNSLKVISGYRGEKRTINVARKFKEQGMAR